jgi:hypothetical protein
VPSATTPIAILLPDCKEVLTMLDAAGFRDVAVEAGYTGRPATADDGSVNFVAVK